ncbi:MOSC domain-containing protein [Brevibacterium oceani]|uniref:MOSC domain-containing protein n=1 Tax=Brevibacterium oceani TaxID=358099 RepID=UPI001B338103|nr:MOSC domain-containing protein [Brevibacterium oceani]
MPQLLPDGGAATWRHVAGPPSPTSARSFEAHTIGFAHIKGTRHELRPGAVVDAGGPIGDREFCLVDVERRTVLKTVQNPKLIQIATSLVRGGDGDDGSERGSGLARDGDELTMVLPDGCSVSGIPSGSGERLTCDYWKRPVELELTEGPHSDLASEWLGTPVRLARAPRGAVVYGSPISIVTTASLRDLSRRMAQSHPGSPDLAAEAARFRATVVIDTDEPYVEETWEGVTVNLGDLRVRIGTPIPRCAVMDLDPLTGERNAPVLKTLAGYRPRNHAGEPLFGVYADVL